MSFADPKVSNNALLTSIVLALSQISSPALIDAAQPLSSPAAQQHQAPSLKDLTPDARRLLLTLHALFPTEFLPALDLLDRNLVTRFICEDISPPQNSHGSQLYFVLSASSAQASIHQHAGSHAGHLTSPRRGSGARSASQSRGRGRFYNALNPDTQYYEVRTKAWNCSCPAFVFGAFPAWAGMDVDITADTPTKSNVHEGEGNETDWYWGGISRPLNVAPVCKHLLACILGEQAPRIFGTFVKERTVSREELAAYVAGMAMDRD